MRISERGIELIKGFEGLRLHSYNDGVGKMTIGYGHTKNVEPGMKISGEQAEQFLREDLEFFENKVNGLGLNLNQNQFDALVSFCFNLGFGSLLRSTLLKKLRLGDNEGAAKEFVRWNKAGRKALAGLTRRRKAEQKLFLS